MKQLGLMTGKIEITLQVLADGDIRHDVETEDGMGDELDILTALGMLEMAKDSLLHPGDEVEEED